MTRGEPSPPLVVAMLKAPRAGLVKTRLARAVGAERAVAIYRGLVERQLAAVPRGWAVAVQYAPADAAAEMRAWLGDRPTYHPQEDGDLGQRLEYAVRQAFARGTPGVIVVGGDCPGLDEATLRAAWEALETVDVVLGPAVDGGYYLIGLKRPWPALFRGIPWSSAEVLAATLQRVREAGLSSAQLPPKEDVDDGESWRRGWESLAPEDPLRSLAREGGHE